VVASKHKARPEQSKSKKQMSPSQILICQTIGGWQWVVLVVWWLELKVKVKAWSR